jgi:hypothetical protein
VCVSWVARAARTAHTSARDAAKELPDGHPNGAVWQGDPGQLRWGCLGDDTAVVGGSRAEPLTRLAALVTPAERIAGRVRAGRRGGAAAVSAAVCRRVELRVFDTHPDPVSAVHLAERERPDLLFGPYGSGPTARVAAATSRLLWNHGGAGIGPGLTVVTVPAPADTSFTGAIEVVHRVLTVQWQDGVRRVVWPLQHAQAALRYPLSPMRGHETATVPESLDRGCPAGR